jgi:phage FluMu protein Com
MTTHDLGTVNVRCPDCDSTQFIQQDTVGTESVDQSTAAVCAQCGKHLSRADIDAKANKIGKALKEEVADFLRKALRGR